MMIHRNVLLGYNPRFAGTVETGRSYLILDDSLSMGGSVASLRGFIENRGGHVTSAMVMNADSTVVWNLPVTHLNWLRTWNLKHGSEVNQFFKENFNYGIDKLTHREGSIHQKRPVV